jgi:hypothetical protein
VPPWNGNEETNRTSTTGESTTIETSEVETTAMGVPPSDTADDVVPAEITEENPAEIPTVDEDMGTEPIPTETVDEPVESPHWTMGTWSGLPQWQCRYCRWSTVGRRGGVGGQQLMEEHVKRHLTPPSKQASGLVSPRGEAL